jgi:hypothetical protein
MAGLGRLLMFVSPRSHPFDAGLLTDTALATLIMAGVRVTATAPG